MKKNQKVKGSVLIAAIIALAIIEVAAFHYGIDGTLRTVIVGVIALIAGVTIPSQKIIK